MKHFYFLVTLSLAACAAQPDYYDGAPRGPVQKSAREDGCSSGYVAAGHPYHRFSKDTPRYISDPVYKSDWDDGFAVCKGQYDAIGAAMRR